MTRIGPYGVLTAVFSRIGSKDRRSRNYDWTEATALSARTGGGITKCEKSEPNILQICRGRVNERSERGY